MPRVCENVEEYVKDTFDEDYNIPALDKKIRAAIEKEIKISIPILIERIREIRRLLKNRDCGAAQIQLLEKEKAEKKKRYEYLKSRDILKDYDIRTRNLISKYRPKRGGTRVFGEPVTESEDWKTKSKRIDIICEFLEIADKYIRVDVSRKSDESDNTICCVNCGENLEGIEIGIKTCRICPECNAENPVIMEPSHISYNEYKGISAVEEVESLDNFIRAMNRWDGSCPGDIPDTLYEKLDEYFESIGFPPKEVVRESKKNFRFRGDSDPILLRRALDAIGSKNHHDINTIGHRYWGWDLPDLSNFRERIINDYKETQRVFSTMPPEEKQRKSSPGTQFRMYKHFRMAGYECYEYEFKIPENYKSRRNQERIFKIMCDRCPNPDIVYIED